MSEILILCTNAGYGSIIEEVRRNGFGRKKWA